MKFLLALSAFLAIASTTLAAPFPPAAAITEAFCKSPGQPCYNLRRLAAALTEPVASADAEARWCWLPGQACGKDKRNAAPWCRFPGQSCGKNKRDAAPWCRMPGQSCGKNKRQLKEIEVAFKAI